MSLLGRFGIPFSGGCRVKRHSTARGIKLAQIALGIGEIHAGGHLIPLSGFGKILRHSMALFVQRTNIVHGSRVPLGGGLEVKT